MVSRENKVIVGFIALTILVLSGVSSVTNPPTWLTGAVIIGLGVIAPILVNSYLDRQESN